MRPRRGQDVTRAESSGGVIRRSYGIQLPYLVIYLTHAGFEHVNDIRYVEQHMEVIATLSAFNAKNQLSA